MIRVVCFGECLVDQYEEECSDGIKRVSKYVGGAPLNILNRLKSFGAEVNLISSIGKDEEAELIRNFFKKQALPESLVQTHPQLPSGKAIVHLNEKKSATYEIVSPVAWDEIIYHREMDDVIRSSDALIFGSLMFRHQNNREVFEKISKIVNFKVCDLNLRAPFNNLEVINFCLSHTDLLKVNDDELHFLLKALSIEIDSKEVRNNHWESLLKAFSKHTRIRKICLTMGGEGSLYFERKDNEGTVNSFNHTPSSKIQVVDTVGAGDSFLAAFLFQYLSKQPIEQALAFGNAVGGLVAEEKGANPVLEPLKIEKRVRQFR